jgi:DNA polymerase-1
MKEFLAYDIEGTGLRRHHGAQMFAYATCDWHGETIVARLSDDETPGGREYAMKYLRELWSPQGATRFAKICHNAPYDVPLSGDYLSMSLEKQQQHEIHETMALCHIFDNQRYSYALDNVAWDLFGYSKDQDGGVTPYLDKDYGYLNCPAWLMTPYQVADVERTMLIFRHYYPKLQENGWDEIYQMECDLLWPTVSMEQRGLMLSHSRTEDMIVWCETETERALEDYQALGGVSTTPQGKDVARVIERVVGVKLTEQTKSGAPSTNKDVMFRLREDTNNHPLIDAILRYRAYKRGIAILEGYLDLADDDGIIHPEIFRYGTRTGRESCSRPNLQNVSKERSLRAAYTIPARRCFMPKPGYVNFHIDYAGIEARLLAHYSDDPNLIGIFTEGDGDFHTAFAQEIYGATWDSANKTQRKTLRDAAKNGDFGLGYGAGIAKFAKTVGLTKAEGEAAHRRVSARFPSYVTMSTRFGSDVRHDGCVRTAFNRRLLMPRNKPYAGTNYVVQGTAAGILKRAQIRVHKYLQDATGGEAALILPIHDELVIEWPRKRLSEAKACLREIRELMIDFPQFSVPMEIEVEISTRDWATVHGYDLEVE